MGEMMTTDERETLCTYPIKFEIDDVLKHNKGGHYQVVGLPRDYVIEATREAAYAYRMADGRICIRSQKEMEDGRFVKVAKVETIVTPVTN